MERRIKKSSQEIPKPEFSSIPQIPQSPDSNIIPFPSSARPGENNNVIPFPYTPVVDAFPAALTQVNENSVSVKDKDHKKRKRKGNKDKDFVMGSIVEMHNQAQEKYAKKFIYENEATVEVQTDRPIHLIAIGDPYFGSRYCDVSKLMDDIDVIRNTPGAFVVFLGNLVSNPSRKKEKKTDTIPHEKQIEFMRALIERLVDEGKIIAAVRSPYDDDSKVASSINLTDDKSDIEEDIETSDVNKRLYKPDDPFPVLINGGNLVVSFPTGLSYRIGLYSKSGPYKSYINRSHGAKREFELDQAGRVDVVMTAYQRIADVSELYVGHSSERSTLAIVQSGTYRGDITGEKVHLSDLKMRDQTAREGEPSGQSVTLYAGARLIEVHLSLEELRRRSEAASLVTDLTDISRVGKLSSLRGLRYLEQQIFPAQPLLTEAIERQEAIRIANEERLRLAR